MLIFVGWLPPYLYPSGCLPRSRREDLSQPHNVHEGCTHHRGCVSSEDRSRSLSDSHSDFIGSCPIGWQSRCRLAKDHMASGKRLLKSHLILTRALIFAFGIPLPRGGDLPKHAGSSWPSHGSYSPIARLGREQAFLAAAFIHCLPDSSSPVEPLDCHDPLN